MARGLKFRIQKVEELYYPCRENKALISFAVTAKLICVFVFAYTKSRFSHDKTHMLHAALQIADHKVTAIQISLLARQDKNQPAHAATET